MSGCPNNAGKNCICDGTSRHVGYRAPWQRELGVAVLLQSIFFVPCALLVAAGVFVYRFFISPPLTFAPFFWIFTGMVVAILWGADSRLREEEKQEHDQEFRELRCAVKQLQREVHNE
jgi:hypothetical protein